MPFAILIIGIFLLVAGVRNTQDDLFGLVKKDFSGDANFFYWFISIMIIGAIGYVPRLKPISNAFLVLVIIVLFLKKGNPKTNSNGGFFEQFMAGIDSTKKAVDSGNSNLYPVDPALQNQLQQNLALTDQRLTDQLNKVNQYFSR